jgi:hypothetical protein
MEQGLSAQGLRIGNVLRESDIVLWRLRCSGLVEEGVGVPAYRNRNGLCRAGTEEHMQQEAAWNLVETIFENAFHRKQHRT